MRFGLKDELVQGIIEAIAGYRAVEKAIIFGSRARGDYAYNSDIDIAIYSDSDTEPGLALDIDDAAGIYKTNIVYMNWSISENLRKEIEREGIEIYRRSDG